MGKITEYIDRLKDWLSVGTAKKMALFLIGLILFLALFSSCAANAMGGKPSADSDTIITSQSETLQNEAIRAAPIPSIVNFFERRMAKMIYELRDNPDFRTHAYIVTMTGKFIKVCDSIGFGLNASVQYSNPLKILSRGDGAGNGLEAIPQAEPNGLFMPEGLAATFVLCVREEEEKLHPVYVEPDVIVSPFPLEE